jgi:O-antigen/teichoic acid export membrane protein
MTQKTGKSGFQLRKWFSDATVKRIYKNASVLLGGKFLAALASIAYIPLATHSLGATLFGVLVLVNGYTRAVAATFTFQVRLALVRYATICLHEKSQNKLRKLLGFMLLIELGFGIIAISMVALLVPFAAEQFSWPAENLPTIVLYSLASVSMIHSMPAGVLFVFGRVRLLALQQTVGPMVRLVFAALAYAMDAGLNGFLMAWLAGSIAEAAIQWFFGLRELSRRGLLKGLLRWPTGITRQHEGIWRFVLTTKLDISLEELSSRATPLAVGWILGPAAAGLYHVAMKIGMILTQPMMLVGQTLSPELSTLVADNQFQSLTRVVLRTGLIAVAAGSLVLLIIAVFGEQILVLYGGTGFDAAYSVLIMIAIGATIQLLGFPMASALVASGRPGSVLKIKLLTSVLLFPALLGLLKLYELNGAGLYAIAFALIVVTLISMAFQRNITRQALPDRQAFDR